MKLFIQFSRIPYPDFLQIVSFLFFGVGTSQAPSAIPTREFSSRRRLPMNLGEG
jgi:hypothetical protein